MHTSSFNNATLLYWRKKLLWLHFFLSFPLGMGFEILMDKCCIIIYFFLHLLLLFLLWLFGFLVFYFYFSAQGLSLLLHVVFLFRNEMYSLQCFCPCFFILYYFFSTETCSFLLCSENDLLVHLCF